MNCGSTDLLNKLDASTMQVVVVLPLVLQLAV